jgi:predicted nucleic acid-binding Zn ribbon protein
MTTSTQYKQFDWTGEQGGINPALDLCPVCSSPLPFSFGSGRPAEYCSNACKMKAYRKRNKQNKQAGC